MGTAYFAGWRIDFEIIRLRFKRWRESDGNLSCIVPDARGVIKVVTRRLIRFGHRRGSTLRRAQDYEQRFFVCNYKIRIKAYISIAFCLTRTLKGI